MRFSLLWLMLAQFLAVGKIVFAQALHTYGVFPQPGNAAPAIPHGYLLEPQYLLTTPGSPQNKLVVGTIHPAGVYPAMYANNQLQAAPQPNPVTPDFEYPWLTDEGLIQAQGIEGDTAELDGTTIGEAPKDTSQTFLRRDAVLMPRGSWEIDWGFAFGLSEDNFPVLLQSQTLSAVNKLSIEKRVLIAPLAFRYGLSDIIQFSCNVPLGWSNTRTVIGSVDEYDNIIGIGDVTFGFSTLVYQGSAGRPQVIVSFHTLAPTANASFPTLSTLAPEASLGSGHWAFITRSIFVQPMGPVVLFGGFGYQHFLPADFNVPGELAPILIEPGPVAIYQMGLGFSVTPEVNLNASVLGNYVAPASRNGFAVPGSVQQPLAIRLSTTLRRDDYVVEPFTQFSVSGRRSIVIGISWTYGSNRKQDPSSS